MKKKKIIKKPSLDSAAAQGTTFLQGGDQGWISFHMLVLFTKQC